MSALDSYDLEAEIVGKLDLLEIEAEGGTLRFVIGADGSFTDMAGRVWLGSRLMSLSPVSQSVNGTAPELTATFSWVQDPDADDLVAAIKAHGGVAAVKGKPVRLYFQHIGKVGDIFAPDRMPVLVTQRVATGLTYSFEGPQQRSVSLSVEGPFNLRARPVGGTYTTENHARRAGQASNPSLEFMPGTTIDEQPLFGL